MRQIEDAVYNYYNTQNFEVQQYTTWRILYCEGLIQASHLLWWYRTCNANLCLQNHSLGIYLHVLQEAAYILVRRQVKVNVSM